MKKYIIIVLASVLSLSAGKVAAQTSDRDLDRQVEVSRDFMPTVDGARKLNIRPSFKDTTTLRPNFRYNVRNVKWIDGFPVRAISPVSIVDTDYRYNKPFYIKLGGGYPGQSVGDIYITTPGNGDNGAGFFLNHYGQYPDIKNDVGLKERSWKTENKGGIFGKYKVSKRTYLEGQVDYRYDVYSMYGIPYLMVNPAALSQERLKLNRLQGFSSPHAAIYFGNDFSDLDLFNYRVGAGFYHIKDRFDHAERGFNIDAKVGKRFSIHELKLGAGFEDISGLKDRSLYNDRKFYIYPEYALETNSFLLSAGFKYVYNDRTFDSKNYFLPQASIEFNKDASAIRPFAELDSKLYTNSMNELSQLNPYTSYDFSMDYFNTSDYILRGGLRGNPARVFSYEVYAGVRMIKDYAQFTSLYNISDDSEYGYGWPEFTIRRERRVSGFYGGADLGFTLSKSFAADLSFNYFAYSLKTYDHPSGMPELKGKLGLKYNYKEKFDVGLSLLLLGTRFFYEYGTDYNMMWYPLHEYISSYNKVDPTVNINLLANYRINDFLGVFLSGENLTGSKGYYYNHYPELGVRVTGGVKLSF